MAARIKELAELPGEGLDTLPKYLKRNRQYIPDMVAFRQKQYGIWNEITWKQSYDYIKYLCLGLVSLGCETGDRIGVFGDNEPELYWAIFAAWCTGGMAFGIWVDAPPSEVKFYAGFPEAKFVFARDQEQVDKLLKIKEEVPSVKKVIWWECKGMNAPVYKNDPWLMGIENLMELGREYEKMHPNTFEEAIERVKPEDVAFLYFTSGTTGLPKAVKRTHKAQIFSREQSSHFFPMSLGDDTMCYFQVASFAEAVMGSVSSLKEGLILNFAESSDTVLDDLREISPKVVLWFPRYWEDMASAIQVKVNDAGFLKRTIFNLCLPVGMKLQDRVMCQKEVNYFWKCLYKIAWLIAFRPTLDKVGFLKTKWGLTGGYMLGEHTFKFLRAIGIDLRQGFGATEQGLIAAHMPSDIKVDSVGSLYPDVQIRVSAEGELLVKSPGMLAGYFKNPVATQKAIDAEGWYLSGDNCYLDDLGHLYFIDRVSELKTLSNGLKYSPQYIEAQMRFGAYVKDCMAIGDESKEYVAVIINIDFNSVGKWAEKNQIPYTTLVDLSQKEEVGKLVVKDVLRVNRTIPEHARIKRYAIFYKEFDADESELTRTRKLRRGFMEQKYADLIQAVYEGKKSVPITTTVTYRDGKVGTISADVKIRDLAEIEEIIRQEKRKRK